MALRTLTQFHLQAGEQLRGDFILDVQQPEQEVLGADVAVLQAPRLLLGASQGVPGRRSERALHPVR